MDTTVPKNDPFTFNCKAEGNPTPTIQWFKDGRELKTDAGSHRIMLPAGGLFFLKVSSVSETRYSIIIVSCLSLCIIWNSFELLPIDGFSILRNATFAHKFAHIILCASEWMHFDRKAKQNADGITRITIIRNQEGEDCTPFHSFFFCKARPEKHFSLV